MNADLATGLIMGLFLGGAGVGIWIGTIAHANYEKYREMKSLAFDFEEKWLDALEGNTDRRWMLMADGAEDPYVVRGRPELERRREKSTSQLSESRAVVYDDPDGPPQVISLADVDDIPTWEGDL